MALEPEHRWRLGYFVKLVRKIWTLRVLPVKAEKAMRTRFWKLERGDPCDVVAESLATLLSAVMWKAKHIPTQQSS